MLTLIKKFRCVSLLLLLCLLSSCSLRPNLPPDYRQNSFEAEISWQAGDLTLTGIVSVRAATDSEPARLQSLQLTAPESLRGLRILWEDGHPHAECHGMTADAALLSELWQTASWLTRSGTITPVALTEIENEQLLYATLQDPSSDSPYEFYLDPESGFPKIIRYEDRFLQIQRFTVTS